MRTGKYFNCTATVVLFAAFLLFAGCTKNKESETVEEPAKSRIDRMTDQAADSAVKKIRTPIDKARSTKDSGDERLESMDKALQQQ